jgi:hypothetical protein
MQQLAKQGDQEFSDMLADACLIFGVSNLTQLTSVHIQFFWY